MTQGKAMIIDDVDKYRTLQLTVMEACSTSIEYCSNMVMLEQQRKDQRSFDKCGNVLIERASVQCHYIQHLE
jgi:hypothetical protein